MLPEKPEAVIPFRDLPVPVVLMYNIWDIAAFIYDKPRIVKRNTVFDAHGENGTSIVWIERKVRQQGIEQDNYVPLGRLHQLPNPSQARS
jgi:hypothetical protein